VLKSQVERSEFTSCWRALALARVIGPLGGLDGVVVESSVGLVVSVILHGISLSLKTYH
jgi:hypothetical protein